ncbi:protein C18orf25 homolog isoform X2 [Eublepharis macularius]|uniref:Protein C18orf25 homolog isoform X2 n=1 Tax=Eublepharis macularius TaxID=481883 RepID=A0AA97L4W7_EUBMA|nr:protein C18orf25 homolog isoform X2 [Eublepharis macularius]
MPELAPSAGPEAGRGGGGGGGPVNLVMVQHSQDGSLGHSSLQSAKQVAFQLNSPASPLCPLSSVPHDLRPGETWNSEMKMEAADKVEELIGPEVPPKLLEKQGAALGEEGPIELETPAQEEESGAVTEDSTVLASMPCLLMELRRDSSESQLASTESDKPTAGRVYESDSSNHCMLSPSSSGHLADSDTLSSAEEQEPSQAEAAVEGESSAVSGSTVGRKSRRSRSESETSTMAAKKNRQSSDKQNGRVAKVKGHRSQKHKERIRLLRQKREAAARKKYNLLQDSSTSDSDLTCDSSTSSSDDDEEVSGSSKTITAEIPDGPPVVAHYDISDTNSDPEVVNVDNLLAAAVVQEHNSTVINKDTGPAWRTRGLLEELNTEADRLDPGFLSVDKTATSTTQVNEEINIASSDSEVEIVGVQKQARCVHPRGGVIQSVSSRKHGSGLQCTRQVESWTGVPPPQNWSSPPEVVDLTLDEDSRRKYLL